MTGAARWGGIYAPTSSTTVAARCDACGGFTALVLSGEGFACRDRKTCARVAKKRAVTHAVDAQLNLFLEMLRAS